MLNGLSGIMWLVCHIMQGSNDDPCNDQKDTDNVGWKETKTFKHGAPSLSLSCYVLRLNYERVCLVIVQKLTDLHVLHDRLWISPWIKSICKVLNITFHMPNCWIAQTIVTLSLERQQRERVTESMCENRLCDRNSWAYYVRAKSEMIYALLWLTV